MRSVITIYSLAIHAWSVTKLALFIHIIFSVKGTDHYSMANYYTHGLNKLVEYSYIVKMEIMVFWLNWANQSSQHE